MYKLLFLLSLIALQPMTSMGITEINDIVEEEFIHEKPKATIQLLDKITAKTQYLDIPVNSEIYFATLKIKAESCWASSPYDLSENKILLEVSEKKIGDAEYHIIFHGWMFSSSPGISSMEHSVYDIVAINCSN